MLLSPSSCGSEEAGYPGFCSSSFISSFDMIELMFTSPAPLFYPNTFQAQKRLISILFQNKGSVKVLALESILAFAKVCKKKTYPKEQHFYQNCSSEGANQGGFFHATLLRCATAPITFRDGGSNWPFATWLVEIRCVYEILRIMQKFRQKIFQRMDCRCGNRNIWGPTSPDSACPELKYQLAQVICTQILLGQHGYSLPC